MNRTNCDPSPQQLHFTLAKVTKGIALARCLFIKQSAQRMTSSRQSEGHHQNMVETKAADGKNSHFWTKLSAAVVCTLVAWGLIVVSSGIIYTPQHLSQPAYAIEIPGGGSLEARGGVDLPTLRRQWPVTNEGPVDRVKLASFMRNIANAPVIEPAEGSASSPVVAAVAPVVDLPILLAGSDASEGERVARKCLSCHTFDQGGRNGVGPNLWDIVGNQRARNDEFNYSTAMREFAGEWSFDTLFDYLENPKKYLRGTNMAFAGLRKPEDRANLLAYMRAQSNSPASLP